MDRVTDRSTQPVAQPEIEATPMPSLQPPNPFRERFTLRNVVSVPPPPLDAPRPEDMFTDAMAPLTVRPGFEAWRKDARDAWVAEEMAALPWWSVDELIRKIDEERGGPYVPLLSFLDDEEDGGNSGGNVAEPVTEPVAPVNPSPRPRARKVQKVPVERPTPDKAAS